MAAQSVLATNSLSEETYVAGAKSSGDLLSSAQLRALSSKPRRKKGIRTSAMLSGGIPLLLAETSSNSHSQVLFPRSRLRKETSIVLQPGLNELGFLQERSELGPPLTSES